MTATRVLRPATFEEAAAALASIGPGARLIAGGTDALVKIRYGAPAPEAWVDLSRITGAAREIRVSEGRVHLGALVDLESLLKSPAVAGALPALAEVADGFASIGIRNLATLGGNICNASPAGDGIGALIVAEARAALLSASGRRELLVEDLFTGPGATIIRPDEVLTGFWCPHRPGVRGGFIRLGARHHHVIAKASVALQAQVEGGRLRGGRAALGSVGPVVIRAGLLAAAADSAAPGGEA